MLAYALLVTFLLGIVIGSFATIGISIKLANRSAAKAAKTLEAEQDEALVIATPIPLHAER